MAKTPRVSMTIDDDLEAQYWVQKRRELKEKAALLETEMRELSEKLEVKMNEKGATEMKWQRKQVARIDDFPTESISGDFAKAMREEESEIWERYAQHGHVHRVVCS